MEIEKAKKRPVMERRIVLLKDFLNEEMSSCSSNGFKSFPRKTRCTYSIRHLVEMELKSIDLTKNPSFLKNHHLLQNKSSSTTTTTSAFHKASVAVINVVKYLTFSSSSKSSSLTSSPSTKQGNYLSTSVSKKLKSKSFWRTNSEKNSRKVEKEINKDIMKWKPFRDLHNRSSSSLTIQTITTTTNTIYSWSPSSSDSECDQHDNHEFKSFKQKKDTESHLHCSSSISISGISNSECCPADDQSDNKQNENCTSTQEIVVVEEEEISIQKGDLRGEQGQYGKVQQFNSPVSTLDFPCEEDEEESSSSSSSSLFQSSLANMEKSKRKLMQKIRRFEGLGQLDPINLSKRIASFEAMVSHDSLESPGDSYASSIFTSNGSNLISSVSEQQEEEEEEDQMSKAEEKAKKLFQCTMKETARTEKSLSSVNSVEDLFLLDFFKDEIIERTTNEGVVVSKSGEEKLDNELLSIAKNWMNGQCDPLDWGLQESRKVHLNEIEKGGHWRINNEDLVFEMEIIIMGSLMDEVLADLLS